MIVDTHCHLDYPGLAEREAEVVANAAAAGIGLMVTIATRRSSWPGVVALTERHPSVVCALGVHPHHAGEEGLDDPVPLILAAAHPKVVAIGESGLDYFYDLAPRDRQATSFRTHIAAARATGLPLVVHTRDADGDTAAILEDDMAKSTFTGVVHCYSSGRSLAERAVAMGLYLGIGGILTFKKSETLRATVADMPLDRLVLETDAPYLAPMPHRSRTNEPAFTAHVAAELARLKGLPLAEIERATTANALRLFAKAAPALRQAA